MSDKVIRGEAADNYAAAQITTDHECSTLAEALDKLAVGIKIIIREGSAAKNFGQPLPKCTTSNSTDSKFWT
jgi:adenine deaminase